MSHSLEVIFAGNVFRPTEPSEEITELLMDWSNGDKDALDRLFPLIKADLHRLARHYMRRFDLGDTLQTTALINETYINLVDQKKVKWQNRAHFFGISARIMRRILLNYVRNQKRLKRGGDALRVSRSAEEIISPEKSDELLALEAALSRLEKVDERKSRVVELRYFGGLSVNEIAEVLKISPTTVMRDWKLAKSWLARETRNVISNERREIRNVISEEREEWSSFSGSFLSETFGDEEPEYSINSVKEKNPEYEGS